MGKTTYSAVGGGVDGDPWLIGNAEQLKDLADAVNGTGNYSAAADNMSGKYIKLTADIDLSELPNYNVGAGWTPIGTSSSIYFAGSFDGGGYEVSNLYINITSSASTYAGLFGYMSGGAISNLGVSGSVNLVSTYYAGSYCGGIAGYLSGGASVINSFNDGDLTLITSSSSGSANVGGIAGWSSSSSISNSHNSGAISVITSANIYAGGIVGSISGNITNCYNTGAVSVNTTVSESSSAYLYVGGIMGNTSGNSIDNYNLGSISVTSTDLLSSYVGGITGYQASSTDISITRNYNAGTISSTGRNTGGIVGVQTFLGFPSANTRSVTNSYNTGAITVRNTNSNLRAGGIVGAAYDSNCAITNCYNTGAVMSSISSVYIGGIAGNNNSGTITSSYYDNTKFMGDAVGSGTAVSYTAGLSTAAMTAGGALTTMSGINTDGAFTKRVNDTDTYYPELSVFYNSASDAVKAASKLSVTVVVDMTKYDSVGEGTSGSPWLISTAAQLKDLSDKVNGIMGYVSSPSTLSGSYIRLAADIDLSELPNYNVAPGWTPIGNYSTTSIYFAGSFDGGGFFVSNLYINITASVSTYAGLFGRIGTGGAISNLGVSGSITAAISGNSMVCYAGGIAAYLGGSITSSYNTGAVSINSTYTANYAGGIAGNNAGSITRCYNTGSVSVTVSTEYSNGSISAGGIAGNTNGNITSCYNSGLVSTIRTGNSGSAVYAGGIAGDSTGTISNSYNTKSVSATSSVVTSYAGGIAGNSSGTIISSYFNNENFEGDAVGYGTAVSYTAGLTTAAMTAGGALTTMTGLNSTGAFVKRANNTASRELYYPELDVFYSSANDAVKAASKTSVTITGYIITYDFQGGTGGDSSTLVLPNSEYTLVVPTRTGYDFVGWYDAASGGIQYTNDDGSSINPYSEAADKTLYARWNVIVYGITYNLNNGTNPNGSPATYTVSGITLPIPTRDGYAFGGWCENAELTGTALTEIAAGSTGNKTFYAKWTAAGGTVPDDITVYVAAGVCVVLLFMTIHKVRKSRRTKKAAAAAEAQMYMQNPYGYNQYGQPTYGQQYGQNPYAQQNPYGQQNPYAQQQQNPYGQQNPYAQQQNSYGQQNNPYNQNGKR